MNPLGGWLLAIAAQAVAPPWTAASVGGERALVVDLVVRADLEKTLAPLGRDGPRRAALVGRDAIRAVGDPDVWRALRQGDLLRVVVAQAPPHQLLALLSPVRPERFGLFRWGDGYRRLDGSGASGSIGPPARACWRFTSAFGVRASPFGGRRMHHHGGVDLGMPVGTDVLAVDDGVVTSIGRTRASGKFVRVRHTGGLETAYLHVGQTHVALGDRVRRGARVASSGATGRATGPHLHFVVVNGGVAVDPERYFPLRPLVPRERQRLLARFAAVLGADVRG